MSNQVIRPSTPPPDHEQEIHPGTPLQDSIQVTCPELKRKRPHDNINTVSRVRRRLIFEPEKKMKKEVLATMII